jgi:hypothetical protein
VPGKEYGERTLVLLSLLGLLLFLASPVLGNTRGSPVDIIKYSHLEPNEPFWVEIITEYGGKTYALAVRLLPDNAVNYDTQKMTQQRVKHPVDAQVIGHVWKAHGSWTAQVDGKTYHGIKGRVDAMSKVLVTEQIDAQIVPDTGGIAPGVIVLAGIALLIGVCFLIWRIVSR